MAGSRVWSESHKKNNNNKAFIFFLLLLWEIKPFKLLTKAFNLTYRFTVKKKTKKQKQNKTYQKKKRKETEQKAGALAKKTKKKTKKQRRRRRRNGLRPPVSCNGDSGYLVSISTGIFGLIFFFSYRLSCIKTYRYLADTIRFGPNLCELAWFGTSWRESENENNNNNNNNQMRHRRSGSCIGGRTPCQATSDSGVAPSQPRWCFLGKNKEANPLC